MNNIITDLKERYKNYQWVDKSSGSKSITYLIKNGKSKMYIKISAGSLIKVQADMLLYLKDKLPVPEILEYNCDDKYGYIIMSEIKGTNFKKYLSCITPKRAVEIYVDAYKIMNSSGVTHGDFCPLNIIIGEEEKVAGFVDFEKGFKAKSSKDLDEAVFIIKRHYGDKYIKYFLQLIGGM